jgi:hypothetical protein
MIGEPKTITANVEEDINLSTLSPQTPENFWRSLLSKTNKTTKLKDRQKKIKKVTKL